MMRSRGFTLIELVVVIVILGIMAATLTVFLKPAIDSYLDTRRRAQLSDMADTALRRMAQDIRSAVPNSLRTNGTEECFQLVPTIAGGRYRKAVDPTFPLASISAPLDTTTRITSFDVFNPLRGGAVNDWVVINNQNGGDVYTGLNRAQITNLQTPPPNPGGATVGYSRITIPATQFSQGYEGGRFVIVPNASQTVVYSCVGTNLMRGVAAFNTAPGAACAAANQIVSSRVQNCTFIYNPNQGATQQNGFIQMSLTLGDGTENVTLVHGVHVENTP